MKLRKGFRIIWPDGTKWDGDCPKWAQSGRKAGYTVISIRIFGLKKWPCGECELGFH
jgi:hypothetical protein